MKVKKIITIVLEIIVIALILWFVLGYINFGKIANNEKPIYVVKENYYTTKDGATVHIYDNIIYKIVVYEKDKVMYSLKLWFMEDI